jgi:hypothetical protein
MAKHNRKSFRFIGTGRGSQILSTANGSKDNIKEAQTSAPCSAYCQRWGSWPFPYGHHSMRRSLLCYGFCSLRRMERFNDALYRIAIRRCIMVRSETTWGPQQPSEVTTRGTTTIYRI